MSNPQQPELARSRKTPHQDQDSVAAVVEGQPHQPTDAPRGPVPPENQPGHHPAQEQDKPDLDAFAQRLGVVEAPPEDGAPATSATPPALRNKGVLAGAAAVVAAIVVLVGLVLGKKRRRGRRGR